MWARSNAKKPIHERIDAVPLLIKVCHRLEIVIIIDSHIPLHGNIKRIPYGQLAIGWIAFILSSATHCKSHVANWAGSIINTLTLLLKHPLTEKDFSDNRLSQLLNHLSNDELWNAIENDLWKAKIEVYEFSSPKIIRVDSTASCSLHQTTEDGIMQFGWSKDF